MKLFTERLSTFPDPRRAGEQGIVDVSDDLSVARLLEAYSFGIFPWPSEGYPTLWFCPPERGVLDFDRLHVPRSLAKRMARAGWTYGFDQDFAAVIDACTAAPRPGQDGTWITPRLRRAYLDFHRAGYAHSVEVRDASGSLVGGLYGTYVAGVFGGESMFYREPDASKAAVVTLIEFLRGRGLTWMDVQMVTPVLQTLGGRLIDRAEYLERLRAARARATAIHFEL